MYETCDVQFFCFRPEKHFLSNSSQKKKKKLSKLLVEAEI